MMRSNIHTVLTGVVIAHCLAFQSNAQTWLQDGTNLVEAANIKSSHGFGAQLWLTDKAEEFFKTWNKETAGVNLKQTREATSGIPFSTIIIFTGPGIGSNDLCDVTGDIVVKKPDGTIYGETRDANIWRNLAPPAPGQQQLAVDSLGIVIEDNDPSGRYTVEATVRDRVKKTQVTLSEHFDVAEQKK